MVKQRYYVSYPVFDEPDRGTILLNHHDFKGLPPHLRHVHTVFQSYALFPHMNVLKILLLDFVAKEIPKDEIHTRVMEALKMVKLKHLAERKPQQLSGGQQQRVAIARAVVNRPLAILLDEPLSSLDYRLRKTMQIELKQLQRKLGIVFIFVTHDQEEALSMSDRIVVMQDGEIQQVGTPREVYEKPRNLTVANFIGEANIFDIEVLSVHDKSFTAEIEGHLYTFNSSPTIKIGQKYHVLIRPEDLRVLQPERSR